MKKLYRYERAFTDKINGNINLVEFEVIRESEKSFFVECYGEIKCISKSSRKRFAYPTEEEALFNFKKRTEHCIKILKSQIQTAQYYLNPRILSNKSHA